jgi:hypothetical protein
MVLVMRCYSTGSNLHFNIAVKKMGNVRKRNTEAQSRLLQWKAVSITYSECMYIALICQLAKRLRRIIVSSVACPTLSYFSKLSHKRHDFRGKKIIENIMCVLMFSKTVVETFIILRIIERNIIMNAYWQVKQPSFLSGFN